MQIRKNMNISDPEKGDRTLVPRWGFSGCSPCGLPVDTEVMGSFIKA